MSGLTLTLLAAYAIAQNAPSPANDGGQFTQQTLKPEATNLSRIIVRFKDSGTKQASAAGIKSARNRVDALSQSASALSDSGTRTGLTYLRPTSTGAHVVFTDQAMGHSALQAYVTLLALDPRVEYAEIDEFRYPHMVPADPEFANRPLWNLKSSAPVVGTANFETAWNRASGAGVVVAVIDSGLRPHADLGANLLPGYDFVSENSPGVYTSANDGDGRDADASDPGNWNTNSFNCPTRDSDWHGTHVAGTIAAIGNNSANGIGGAFKAKILPVRVLGVCGGYIADVADGIKWAAGLPVAGIPNNANPAKVLNLSLGDVGVCSATEQSAITAARAAGAVVVVSTGNDGTSTIESPANCVGVIAVTAHSENGDRANYADIGVGTTLSAPGGGYGFTNTGLGRSIFSTANNGLTTPTTDAYVGYNGTSTAAPHVSAAAALRFQFRPSSTPDQIQTALVNAARPFPEGSTCTLPAYVGLCGAGLLDASTAVYDPAAPVLATIAGQTVAAGASISFQASATSPSALAISYSARDLPAGANMSTAGAFSWTNAAAGTYNVVVSASDGTFVTSQVVTLQVNGPATSSGGGGGGGSPARSDLALLALLMGSTWLVKRRAQQR